MGRLFKPTIVRYLDADGRRCRKGAPGARKKRSKSKTWRGEYTDADGNRKSVGLCSNKEAARHLLHELEVKAARGRAGLADPFEEHHQRLLSEHLVDFVETLRDAGRSEDYLQPVESRVRKIIDGCKFRLVFDISASRVQAFLAGLKRDGMGQRTVNHYLAAIKQFTQWLVEDRRTDDNRLAHLKGGNAKLDIRRERRELTDDEIGQLLETAQNCKRPGFCLNGRQRFMLYTTALGTGLRAKELASLTPAHFELDAQPPTVRIDAADEKARRGDVIPIPIDLGALLKPWLATMLQDAPLWPGKWAKNKRAGKFMQSDLKRAGIPYVDVDGRYADFHALRHTYLSRLGRSGASPKAMQRLARHTTVELTLGRYTHANLLDLASAVDGMPPVPVATDRTEAQQVPLTATGAESTQSGDQNMVAGLVADFGDNHCDSVSSIETRPAPENTDNHHRSPPNDSPQLPAVAGSCGSLRHDDKESGSGWESNPPGDFSDATLGLKPRAVTRSAYTPGKTATRTG